MPKQPAKAPANPKPADHTGADQESSATPPKNTGKKKLPIVALGASAGGLEAFERFFRAMKANSDIGFVLIAHLDPSHVSLLPELIQKHTTMKVHAIRHRQMVEANNVYVIPPNKNLSIRNGCLQLSELPMPRGVNLPINCFFRALAADQGNNAVAIVLSGTGTDGSLGLKAIKGEAGMVMVQDEDSAKYNGMPRSAIATGLADFVLPPEQMAEQLVLYTHHAFQKGKPLLPVTEGKVADALQKIYGILRTYTDHDFSLYKKNTICRRIERRMNLHQMTDIEDYASYLQSSEREVHTLFNELLIGVTNFFRDAMAFDLLRDELLDKALTNFPDGYTIRAWVAGCSSGEEAYSLAIVLHEWIQQTKNRYHVQIFGTDIDEEAIAVARAGVYPESIEADVQRERLERYFLKLESGQYRITKSIREMVVFAVQNIISDPPFTNLNIVSCRNVLIYFGSELQQKLLPVFHYSLQPSGLLFLGTSESIGHATNLFSVLDKKWKIFARNPLTELKRPVLELPATLLSNNQSRPEMPDSIQRVEDISALQLVETILRQSNTPPCAIIDSQNNIIYVHGSLGRFLEPAQGRITVNILEMARQGIKAALASVIRKVATHKQEVSVQDLQIENHHGNILLNLIAKPISQQHVTQDLMMVIFDEQQPSLRNKHSPAKEAIESPTKTAAELAQELRYTKENLHTTIEEMETSNEELKSANEELQSTNEELQSTNEELETSKEELQSLNEESSTVNAELQSRIDELSRINDDMKNLLDSTDLATLFLDVNLCIRRFTSMTTGIMPLTATDIGRPVKHFSSILVNTDLAEYSEQVLEDLVVREKEAKSKNGDIYALRIRPYRTTSNIIDGVVITFDNITIRKRAEVLTKESEELYRLMFDMAQEAVVLINPYTKHIVECNQIAFEQLGYTREEFMTLTLGQIEETELSIKVTLPDSPEVTTKEGNLFTAQHKSKDGKLHKVKVKANSITFNNTPLILTSWKYC